MFHRCNSLQLLLAEIRYSCGAVSIHLLRWLGGIILSRQSDCPYSNPSRRIESVNVLCGKPVSLQITVIQLFGPTIQRRKIQKLEEAEKYRYCLHFRYIRVIKCGKHGKLISWRPSCYLRFRSRSVLYLFYFVT